VNFRVRVDAAATLELTGATTRRVPLDIGLARFDLALELQVHDSGVLAQFNYDTELFDAATIDRLANDFVAVLRQAVAAPETRLLDFRLAGEWASAGRIAEGAGIRSFRSRRVLSGLVGLAHVIHDVATVALPALGELAEDAWPVLASLA
jgi:non-ribosomal peptide synthetase component F